MGLAEMVAYNWATKNRVQYEPPMAIYPNDNMKPLQLEFRCGEISRTHDCEEQQEYTGFRSWKRQNQQIIDARYREILGLPPRRELTILDELRLEIDTWIKS